MTNDNVFSMTKDEIYRLLVNATENISIDVSDDLLNVYSQHAKRIGVSVDDLMSAVVTCYIKELKLKHN